MIIALIGPDGSGKTTYAEFLQDYFEKRGKIVKIFYPFNYFLLRKLLDKFTRNKKIKKPLGTKKNSKFIFNFWPFIALIDNWLDYLLRLRRFKGTAICDRYYYDLATSFIEFRYSFGWLYKLYLKCIPKPNICFVLIAPPDTLQKRETDDTHDLSFFERQVKRYEEISKQKNFFLINTYEETREKCKKLIKDIVSSYL